MDYIADWTRDSSVDWGFYCLLKILAEGPTSDDSYSTEMYMDMVGKDQGALSVLRDIAVQNNDAHLARLILLYSEDKDIADLQTVIEDHGDTETVVNAVIDGNLDSDIAYAALIFSKDVSVVDLSRLVCEVPDVDVDSIRDIIISDFTIDDMIKFVSVAPGGDNDGRVRDIVLASRNAYRAFTYVSSIKGVDIEPFQKIIVNSGNINVMLWLAEQVPGADLDVLHEAISSYGTKEEILDELLLIEPDFDLDDTFAALRAQRT